MKNIFCYRIQYYLKNNLHLLEFVYKSVFIKLLYTKKY